MTPVPVVDYQLRCRKCRSCISTGIQPQVALMHGELDVKPARCSTMFLDDIYVQGDGMHALMDEDGRLLCANERCRAKVGHWSWKGGACSCGEWVAPAFGISHAKVDISKVSV
eukprot:Partr_v1_DN26064_c1_g1_i1_m324 putative Dual specificity phosphatase